MTDVLVLSELADGKLRKATLSAVSFAKQITEGSGGAFDLLVIGEGTEAAAQELAGFGARKILKTEIAGGYVCEKYAATIAAAAKTGYGVVATTATAIGKDLLPRVAAKLGAALAVDIVGVEVGEPLKYRRSLYAGNVLASVTLNTPIQAASVCQSEFTAAEPSGGDSPVEAFDAVADAAAERIEFVSIDVVKSERPDLAEAEVVVAGGRGLKSADNFKNVLEPLVDVLGAAMGASRAACDAGYVPGDLQIGQTGKVVAPKLYIAVAISGAIQHVAGMKGSQTIVAINKNKEEPIAQIADYFWEADLFEAVPMLTEAIKKAQAAE